jgi:hypothetical protein
MIRTWRLAAGAAAALALAGTSAAGASSAAASTTAGASAAAATRAGAAAGTAAAHAPRPVLPSRVVHIASAGVTADVTIRGNWKRSSVRLPRPHLPRPHGTSGAQPSAASGSVTSGNWSGYAAVAKNGATLRYVTANFNIPNLNCANSAPGTSGLSYYSSWTGLDGWNDATVEQQGIESYCDGASQGLWVFYEMFPADPVAFTGANPGDAIKASTYYNAGTGRYELTVTDLTQSGAGVSASIPCAKTCLNKSAEVISEAPGGGPPAYGLADFGAEGYTNAAVTSRNGTKGNLTASSLWNSFSIRMTGMSAGDTLAQPGPLQGGTAFLDEWKASL